jgi:hypothetical protein
MKFHGWLKEISINLVFNGLTNSACNKKIKNGDEHRLHNLINSHDVDMITYENYPI